jgi:hypothetical protein
MTIPDIAGIRLSGIASSATEGGIDDCTSETKAERRANRLARA